MKRFLILAFVFLCSIACADAQSFIGRLGRSAAQSAKMHAEFSTQSRVSSAVNRGVDNLFSGKAFKAKKKSADEVLVSYLNSEYGFKGQYPKSYSREDDNDGTVTFSSKEGDVAVVYYGDENEKTIDEIFAENQESVMSEYELLSAKQSGNSFTMTYNMGGTIAAVRTIKKGNIAASIAVCYPEGEEKYYKKTVEQLLDGLTFYK